jgi:hypothetical protein
MNDSTMPRPPIELLRRIMEEARSVDDLPDPSTDEGRATREFFANSWDQARTGLLSHTDRIRVQPLRFAGPRAFTFEVDRPYRRRLGDGTVELSPGPITGAIHYRPDLMVPRPGARSTVVFIDKELGFYHPNYSRAHGVLCIGDVPGGPFPLDALLGHLFGILSYQNRESRDPADLEAVRYFASDPHAMAGLEDVAPLY